jgi:hypothetical protein
MEWCYVDPCFCDAEDLFESSVFDHGYQYRFNTRDHLRGYKTSNYCPLPSHYIEAPINYTDYPYELYATNRSNLYPAPAAGDGNSGVPMYYSYSTCGQSDAYTDGVLCAAYWNVSVCNNDARCLWDYEYWNYAPETDPSKTLAYCRARTIAGPKLLSYVKSSVSSTALERTCKEYEAVCEYSGHDGNTMQCYCDVSLITTRPFLSSHPSNKTDARYCGLVWNRQRMDCEVDLKYRARQ